MYTLFHDKENLIIEVKPKEAIFSPDQFTDEIYEYNQYYYFCKHRLPLIVLAKKIRQEWATECQEYLDRITRIKC